MSYYTLCLSFVLCFFKNSSVLLHFVIVCNFYFFHDCFILWIEYTAVSSAILLLMGICVSGFWL